MNHYAGIDVFLESSSVCVVDATGKMIAEAKVASEPEALVAWLRERPEPMAGIGLEAGPLSQWLFAALEAAGLPAVLLETRHVRTAFKTMPIQVGAGEDGPQGRARDRAADAAGLVSAGALQVGLGAGDARAADGAQAAAGQAS